MWGHIAGGRAPDRGNFSFNVHRGVAKGLYAGALYWIACRSQVPLLNKACDQLWPGHFTGPDAQLYTSRLVGVKPLVNQEKGTRTRSVVLHADWGRR